MTNRNQVDDIFRCLLSDINARLDTPQRRVEQSQQLLSAFNAIQDTALRQELVTLIEIIALMPEAMQGLRDRPARGQLMPIH